MLTIHFNNELNIIDVGVKLIGLFYLDLHPPLMAENMIYFLIATLTGTTKP